MESMGSRNEPDAYDLASKRYDEARQHVDTHLRDGEDQTEIAYPEDRYSVACIGCRIEMHLQMIPHRDEDKLLVGWIFCCEKCKPNIIGRRVWFGDESDRSDREAAWCPFCKEIAVHTHYQNEEGDWFVCWLCNCEPDPEIIAEAKRVASEDATT